MDDLQSGPRSGPKKNRPVSEAHAFLAILTLVVLAYLALALRSRVAARTCARLCPVGGEIELARVPWVCVCKK